MQHLRRLRGIAGFNLPLKIRTALGVRHIPLRRSSNAVQSEWTELEEPLADYSPNGYNPLVAGDILGAESRYRVVRKLGWGNYSTVWLVQERTSGIYSAMKVMTAEASQAPEIHELEYLQCVRDRCPEHPGHAHVLHLVDHFYEHGPNGKHLCLVTELLAESLHSFSMRFQNDKLPLVLVKQVTRQMLQALDYLHNSCNIIHTDIKPANMLLTLPPTEAKYEIPSEATAEETPTGNIVSRVKSSPLPYPLPDDVNSSNAWDSTTVKLIDLGVSCWADKVDQHFTDLIQSPALRAPEVCVGAGWGKPADIWSFGCTMYELATGRPLMQRDVDPISVPFIHAVLFGPYPRELVKRGKYSANFFNDDGSIKYEVPERPPRLATMRAKAKSPEYVAFLDFLESTLKLDPDERPSTRQLLEHPWLTAK